MARWFLEDLRRVIDLTAIEYFNQARLLNVEINTLIEESQSIRDMATKVTSVMTDMPGAPLKNNDGYEETLIKLADYDKAINNNIDRLVDLKHSMIEIINQLPKMEYRIVLVKRYLFNKCWAQIAVDMGYEKRQVQRFHDNAIRIINKTCHIMS